MYRLKTPLHTNRISEIYTRMYASIPMHMNTLALKPEQMYRTWLCLYLRRQTDVLLKVHFCIICYTSQKLNMFYRNHIAADFVIENIIKMLLQSSIIETMLPHKRTRVLTVLLEMLLLRQFLSFKQHRASVVGEKNKLCFF